MVDGAADHTHRYGGTGTWAGSFGIDVGSTPRGAATNTHGDRLWVIQSDKKVYVYDTADDTLLGTWTANGLNTVEDITIVGNDVYIVDSGLDKVFKFSGGANLLSGSHSAGSSFSLNSNNLNSTGIVSNGSRFWVTDKSSDKVFVYNMSGQLQGSWNLDSANGRASGITYDPTSTDLWVTDYDDGVIYRYINALNRTSGSQSAGQVIPLAPTNAHPEGIADPVFVINIGDPPINGAITTPAQVDEYQFTAAAGQSIYIDWQLVSGGATNIRLLAPGGTVLLTDSATTASGLDNGPIVLATAGMYTLEVRGNGTSTPTYRFQVFDVPATVPVNFNIGDIVNGGIGMPGEIDAFTFAATAGQVLYFDRQIGSGFLDWRLQSPSGSEVFSPSFTSDQGPLVMPATGTYTLRWDGQGDRVEAYRFQIVEVPPTITLPIAIGDVVEGAISVQGEVDKYTIEIAAGQQLYFNSQLGSSFLGWNLVGPTGTVFADFYSDDQGPLSFATSGTYTLTVDGSGDRVESYRFQITEVPPTVTTHIGYEMVINGAISAPGEVDLYTFDGVAGQQLYFDSQIGSPFLGWNLKSPTGTTLWGDFFSDDQGLVTLPTTGVYTLTVDGSGDRVEAYQFQIWDCTWPPTQAIQLNETISDFMASPPMILHPHPNDRFHAKHPK